MRLFIAALLPKNVLEELQSCINSFNEDLNDVKWEKAEKLHLTLNFLGNVEQARVKEISSFVEALVRTYSPFVTNLKELGAFPRLKNPRVLYVGLSQNEQLAKFHRELYQGMSQFGFTKEERKFIPHVTIGRVKKRISIDRPYKISKTEFEINQIGIIKSELRREGSVYTPIKILRLDG